MGKKLGKDAKLYYSATLMGDTPSFVEMTNVKDVTLNLEKGESDVSTRGNNGWRAIAATLKDGSVEFQMVWDTADAGFTAIQTAYFGDTPLAFAIMDGDIDTAGSQGLQADFEVTNFTRNEPLEEALTVNVTIKPAYSDTPPTWVTVS